MARRLIEAHGATDRLADVVNAGQMNGFLRLGEILVAGGGG